MSKPSVMGTLFDFRNIFVLDMANNHQGDVEHALEIINQCGKVANENGARVALKFQFRCLPSFIHPSHRNGSTNKHIPRFLSTALNKSDYARLTQAVREVGLTTIATPFDEESVDLIESLDIEVIKIASCSANDWPLIERVSLQNRPVVVSTAGLTLKAIDDLVSFFDHRKISLAFMHCVAIYPTPLEHLQLNQVALIKQRYPNLVVGFSTHESPDDLEPVTVAVAKGAEILERHVGIPSATTPLNAYSSTPEQIALWIKAAQRARIICGELDRVSAPGNEQESLVNLARGVYVREPIKRGDPIKRKEVYFAMPTVPGALTSGQWRNGIRTRANLATDEPLLVDQVDLPSPNQKQVLFNVIHEIKARLNKANVVLPVDFKLEFSHHYGIDRFLEVGATLIDCVNRSYCKKVVVQLPGQRHPNHHHKKKEETFQVLDGIMEVTIDGRRRTLYSGDILLVQQGVWHSFWTDTGLIFEEISSTHHNDDSFYEDKSINVMPREERKTIVNHWGTYQI